MNSHAARYPKGLLGGRRTHSRSALLCALLTVTIAGCKEVQVFPKRVQVEVTAAGTTTVDVWARYQKKKGGEILNAPLTWDVPPGVLITPSATGRDASLVIPSAAAAVYHITVRAEGKSDALVVEVVAPAGDQASALENAIPSVAMTVSESGSCPADHTVAFVRRAALEARAPACLTPDVARLSAYAAPKRGAVVWTPGSDAVDFPTAAVLQTVPVRVWILYNDQTFASSGLTAAEFTAVLDTRANRVDDAIHVANGIFGASRVGARIDRIGTAVTLFVAARTCTELLAAVALDDELSGGAGAPDVWQRNAINVYVMDAFTDARGQYCRPPANADPRNVLRLQSNALPSTLSHELGHLWGLVVPWGQNGKLSGHVDKINGFAQDNVMWGRVNLGTTAARTRLSLGQVYRMNFDRRSHLATGSPTDCGCDPFGTTCRRLSHDVRPLARADGALGASAAYCEAP